MIALLGGQAVVNPAAWTWPSDHSVWNSNWFSVTQTPLSYSGATVNGSAYGLGMLFGLLTDGSVREPAVRRGLVGLHLGGEQRLAQAVGELAASRRLRFGPKAERFYGPLNPPQTNQSPPLIP